jgi:HSP20 family protein
MLRRGSVLSPFEDLFLRGEMDEWFDSFFRRRGRPANGFIWAPPVNVREDEDALYVEAELPGLTRDEIQLSVENGVLTITGEKREERTEGKPEGEVHVFERRYGRFERRLTLPTNVDAEKIRARYENGVLGVTLPKTEEAKPRQIQIEGK